ncbi:MAG: hypothetical protein PHR56_02960 [Dehalococcoidales bacterium]|nr:hypothetical protein [Dehalococcoidales bacterium]
MNIFTSLIGIRIVFILGIVNALLFVFLLITCRCLPMSSIGKKWLQNATYKRFYGYHCYLWWVFGASVIVHVIFAIGAFGIPF